MALETGTYISDLVATNPTSTDPKSVGDDHFRFLKSTIKATFPNVNGAVNPTPTEFNHLVGVTSGVQAQIAAKGAISGQTWTGTHAFPATTSIGTVSATEISYVDGVTSAIQGQIDGKGAIAGQAWAGAQNFTGATITVPTLAAGTATTAAASTAFVAAAAFSAVLPGQTGNAGKFVTTDGTAASWAVVTPPSVVREARTSNTVLAAADNQKLIDITSGTFTQTFTAAATLGTGWYCFIKHSGTGRITLDPNGAELIDGLSSFIMYPGETRLVQCDGTGFNSVVLTPFSATLTATEVITRPPGYTLFGGLLSGGGGGGGRSGVGAVSVAGGGGGACNPFSLTATQFGASQTITIGAGGVGRTTAAVGGTGGTSSIGTLVYAYGGGGGGGGATDQRGGGGGGALSAGANGSASAGNGGAPGVSSTSSTYTGYGLGGAWAADSVLSGYANSAYGGAGGGFGTVGSQNAGNSVYGGGGGAGVSAANASSTGGTSQFGGAGGDSSAAGNGVNGTVGGGGGGATQTGTTSGAGGAGRCIIWGVA